MKNHLILISLAAAICFAMPAFAATTIHPVTFSPESAAPGETVTAMFHFEADGPYSHHNAVFVHIMDKKGRFVVQLDHDPPTDTDNAAWRGKITYTKDFVVPESYDNRRTGGEYRVVMGFYHKASDGNWKNEEVVAGPGTSHDDNNTRCLAGKFTINRPGGNLEPAITTVHRAELSQDRVPPGAAMRVKYRFEAEHAYPVDNSVFVHIMDENGRRVDQADHLPGIATGSPGWVGTISYTRDYVVREELPLGTYRMVVGLYHADDEMPEGWANETLMAGPGVAFDKDDPRRCVAAVFTVDRDAPMPPGDTERAATLNLEGFKLVFDEDFSQPLDVSPWGPGTRWIAHTPWAGDFGDARFMDPTEDFPFTIKDGIMRIEARKSDDFIESDPYNRPWRAGLLSSCDPRGNGFALQYGYFEARMKMPAGPGVWPAFWLASAYDRKTEGAGKDGSIELDPVEYYGHFPSSYRVGLHVWEPQPHHGDGSLVTTRQNEPATGFHNYGVMVTPDFITFYFDGVEVWRQPTPPAHNKPLMLLVNFALGSGYSTEHTPNPSFLDVEYVRAYAMPE